MRLDVGHNIFIAGPAPAVRRGNIGNSIKDIYVRSGESILGRRHAVIWMSVHPSNESSTIWKCIRPKRHPDDVLTVRGKWFSTEQLTIQFINECTKFSVFRMCIRHRVEVVGKVLRKISKILDVDTFWRRLVCRRRRTRPLRFYRLPVYGIAVDIGIVADDAAARAAEGDRPGGVGADALDLGLLAVAEVLA